MQFIKNLLKRIFLARKKRIDIAKKEILSYFKGESIRELSDKEIENIREMERIHWIPFIDNRPQKELVSENPIGRDRFNK